MAIQSARRPVRGFTLIELMIVVSIIGILASVAIPSFQRYLLTARASERGEIVRAIKMSVDNLYATRGRLPGNFIWGSWNPIYPGDARGFGVKRPFLHGQPGWRDLDFHVEGSAYYSYLFFAWEDAWNPNNSQLIILVTGDLDLNAMSTPGGQYNKQYIFRRVDGVFQPDPWTPVWPPDPDYDTTVF